MKAPTRVWVPIEEAKIGETYIGYKTFEKPNCYNMCEVLYKGDGIGWIWSDPKHEQSGISHLERYTTFQEQDAWYKKQFNIKDSDTYLNLYGLFHDMYDTGTAAHEMWNAWVSSDFYEMNAYLKDENMILIGVAAAPYEWNVGGDCCALIIEDKVTGCCYWCHAAQDWIDDMREQMREIYEENEA